MASEVGEARKWVRVSHRMKCGVCDKPDWCTRSDDGWCCMRVESTHEMKNGGWFHPFDSDKPEPTPKVERPKSADTINAGQMIHTWQRETDVLRLDELVQKLSVSVESLNYIGAAWAQEYKAWAFPMLDQRGKVIGIRLRSDTRKWAVTGSRSGVFLPMSALTKISSDRIFICEGPTDTAACLTLGLFAIGRPSCLGCEDMICNIIWQLGPYEVAVVFDNDGPGVRGAEKLIATIKGCRVVRFVPPCKDMRTFVASGGKPDLISAMLDSTRRQVA